MKMQVLNKRTGEIPAGAIYVGRGSPWGNIYPINSLTTRAEAIKQYIEYARERLVNEPEWLKPLTGLNLVCFCKPLDCHADWLLEQANG